MTCVRHLFFASSDLIFIEMKQLFYIILPVSLLALSCTGGGRGSTAATGLRIGAMSSMDYLPYVVACDRGIYDSLGVNVEIVKFFSANDRDAAFQSGNVDGTVIDLTGAVMQQAAGTDLKVVMKHDGVFTLVARSGAGIESVSGLKGRNIAVSRNTVIEYSTDKMLQQSGVDPASVVKTEVNKIPLRLEMLRSGQTDACILPDPFATMALADGGVSLGTTGDAGISVTATVLTGDALRNKAEAVSLLIEGYNLAVEYMRSHPVEQWRDIIVKDAGVPEALLPSVSLPEYMPASLPSAEDVRSTVQWLESKGLVSSDYDMSQLVDSTFAGR